jgi:transcription antitermination factor NusG
MEWYGIYTRSRHEQQVNQRLTEKAFETFFPRIEVWSQWKDRRKRILKPLFTGYLFVRTELDRYRHVEILETNGVVRVLGNNGQGPLPVPDWQIDSVRRILKVDVAFSYHPYLNVGDRVRVVAGSLAGAEGILLGHRSRKSGSSPAVKLVVSVDLLNRAIAVEIDATCVEKA